MKRKNIALFTAQPEAAHTLRIINGIAEQCRKYGYHFSVFTPMTHMEFNRKAYTEAEARIYELADLDRIDGLILDAVNLVVGEGKPMLERLLERLKDRPSLPAVSLEMSIGDLPVICSRNEDALREMCRHAIEVHGKKDICILTGQQGNEVAESRLAICLDEIEKHGLAVSTEHVVYGDFWYSSGDALARSIAEGKIPRPEAVLCTSTHMALGLIYRLRRLGIGVPEDVIVIGFDTTNEGCCNEVILSAYDAADALSAAETVDYIRRIIDPGKEIIPYETDVKKMFYAGMSCGCDPNIKQSIAAFLRSSYLVAYNSSSDQDMNEVSFGRLMESYSLEEFTSSGSPEECFEKMGKKIYLLHPYRNYQLCLRKEWLTDDAADEKQLPSEMNIVFSAWETPDLKCLADLETVTFPTAVMTPLLEDESLEPSVFYFSPVHFEGTSFGYCVLRRSLEDKVVLSLVYRTWLRFVNNALEMTRTRMKLLAMSVRDSMTGLFNRRGMEMQLEKLLERENGGGRLFVAVIDMDGLKQINDTYGHSEGDAGILAISRAVLRSARDEEFCVRAGGDEFFIIGVGNYGESELPERAEEFRNKLQKIRERMGKPYEISASIGCAVETIDDALNIDSVIGRADKKMYEEKLRSKKQRMQ
ncbi:MAG: GGDEF domain-containing protein [Lachnospiraceae bacterium]|nr:GGDEF domain-containing protein [Lachnospiraceae bacterium]